MSLAIVHIRGFEVKIMVFSSIDFIFFFLPVFLACYYFVGKEEKNACLLLFSAVFYGYGAIKTPFHIALMIISVIVNYILAIFINNYNKKKGIFLFAGILYNFGCLFIYKYAGFFGLDINLILPLGISFYTFQNVAYLVDVYRGTVKAERNFVDMATYIMMFPKLTSGPIANFSEVQLQLKERSVTLDSFFDGVEYFVLGIGLKVLLANQIGGLWSDITMIGVECISAPLAWMGIFAYSLQLYFDFYGYSLMAVGLGRMIGLELPHNFNTPYISVTMTEFWRRWHITLGRWFREYLYIPLGGNRKGKVRTYINLLVVWLFTGLWHGAAWNFVIWGLFLFVLIALEKAFYGKFMEKHRIIGHIYMLFMIPISWLMFASTDLNFIAEYLQRLVGIAGVVVFENDYISYVQDYGLVFIIGLILSITPIHATFDIIKKKFFVKAILILVLVYAVYGMYMGLNDPFMYFKF